MATFEVAYHQLIKHVLAHGTTHKARNATTTRLLNQSITANLQDGFPIITGREMPFDGVKGELLSFIRGYHELADIQSLGCHFWDKNCEAAGATSIGPGYGFTWRSFSSFVAVAGDVIATQVDQLYSLVKGLINEPESRRHMLLSTNPALASLMVLPPCHVMAQWHVLPSTPGTVDTLHCTVTMRSCDLMVGLPADMALYALFTELLAVALNFKPGTVHINMADCHIYDENKQQALAYLRAETHPLPDIAINLSVLEPLLTTYESIEPADISVEDMLDKIASVCVTWLESIEPADISLTGYTASHALRMTMVA